MSQIGTTQTHSGVGDGRERIMHSAMRLFAERGYDGVSISDVADSAGVVKSAIYHHFAGKEALYLAVLEQACQESRRQMEEAAVGNTWWERLRGAVQIVSTLIGPQSHILFLLLGGEAQLPNVPEPARQEAAASIRHDLVAVLAREIGSGIAAGELRPIDPELAGMALIGLVAGLLRANPEIPRERRIDMAMDFFRRGAAAS